MGIDLSNVYQELLKGNLNVLTSDVRRYLSYESVRLAQQTNHNQDEINEMKYLVMICNLLYNRTDMSVLPVEDGVYDLLLEAYRKYDPHFQVGSAVVNFSSQTECSTNSLKKEVRSPIFFYDKVKRDELSQQYFDRLSSYDLNNKFNRDDLVRNPITYDYEYITKREHNVKHNHPTLVGTLDKCKFVTDQDAITAGVYDDPNVKVLERDFFGKHIQRGIISPTQDLDMVLELKYDGISVEADCNHEVVSARSRGDTGTDEASDMTPILKGYQFHHNNVILDHTIGVKFEAIMTKDNLYQFNQMKQYNYANCRTAIIGLFGSSDANRYRDLITLVPLAVDRSEVPEIHNRVEEIEFCNRLFRSHGEPLRYIQIHGNYQQLLYQIKKFADEAFAFRDYANFMYDGIVVSYLDEGIRRALGRENFINKFSMAVKFNPLSKLTRFYGYTYEVGQNGMIVPMFHYEPVEFLGTIHTKSSGSSYARFQDYKLKVNDIVKLTYVNDVMPYLTPVDCEENRNNPNPVIEFPKTCPECGANIVISDSGKTAYCPNQNCPGRVIGRVTNMIAKLGIKGFAESTVKALNIRSFRDLMELDQQAAENIIGPVNAANLKQATENIKNNGLPDYVLIGSLGFSGIAQQKWKLIFDYYTIKDLLKLYENKAFGVLSQIQGIGEGTALTIAIEFGIYLDDINYILNNVRYENTRGKAQSTKKQIRFSGCRNLQLQQQLSNLGYDIDGNAGVTKKTDILLVPYQGFTSTKTAKVSPSCKIIPIDEFKNNMQLYL